jgi:hypothetical protein
MVGVPSHRVITIGRAFQPDPARPPRGVPGQAPYHVGQLPCTG